MVDLEGRGMPNGSRTMRYMQITNAGNLHMGDIFISAYEGTNVPMMKLPSIETNTVYCVILASEFAGITGHIPNDTCVTYVRKGIDNVHADIIG